MRELTNSQIKDVLQEILSDFADYCDENGLRYYLFGGTLLGGARHKGFIPWDDDIDVVMPRPDYVRFHELVQVKPIHEKYRVSSLALGNSPYPFAKIEYMDYLVLNTRSSLHPYLWIDVFPLDGVPKAGRNKHFYQKRKFYAFLLEQACVRLGSGKNLVRAIIKLPIVIIAKMFGAFYFGKKIDTMAQTASFEEGGVIENAVWGRSNEKERMDKEAFLCADEMEFEGRMYHVPGNWELVLSGIYGDWRTPPPEHLRINHGIRVGVDEGPE